MRVSAIATVLSVGTAFVVSPAMAQTAASARDAAPDATGTDATSATLQDIVVTAQKREQSLNSVGLSVSALSGDTVKEERILVPADLVRIVPGLTVTTSQYNSPTYSLRGVGFYDTSLGAPSPVSVYVDEVPIAFAPLALGALLDVERVEVLKGPQGTLFGQSSTGGAINYIAAKPTDVLRYGATASVARFGQIDADGFISGTIAQGLSARLAFATSQGGAWQQSQTRPGDTLGDKRYTAARLLLDARPTDRLRFQLNVNGWIDRSDTPAWQDIAFTPNQPTTDPLVINAPIAGRNARQADWSTIQPLRNDNRFGQVALRADLDLGESLTVTSISAYSAYRQRIQADTDGTAANSIFINPTGHSETFSQELRLAATALNNRLHALVGVNYQKDDVSETQLVRFGPPFPRPVGPFGFFDSSINRTTNTIESKAIFANADFEATDKLGFTAGIRYTDNDRDFLGCTSDSGNGQLAAIVANIQQFALGVPRTATPGQCTTLRNDAATPAAQFFTTGPFVSSLDENNVSWRLGINFKPAAGRTLIYGTVSQGFKAGSFPTNSAIFTTQLQPITQEKLRAYEVGIKTPLGESFAQLNASAYYYQYKDKQLLGAQQILGFGVLQRLLNIPRSRIWGADVDLVVRPTRGLTIKSSLAYVNTRILANADGTPFLAYPAQPRANPVNVTGNAFPYVPEFTISGDVEYTQPVSSHLKATFGARATYRTSAQTSLATADPSRPADLSAGATNTYNDPLQFIPAYTLVDIRATLEPIDGPWRVSVWGRNITNQFYAVNVLDMGYNQVRLAGRPVTYGVTVGFKY